MEEVEDSDFKNESQFYTEKSTGFIYEVKLFPDFAMIRPATPEALANISKISLVQLVHEFTEYLGEAQAIREYLWGSGTPENIVVDKK